MLDAGDPDAVAAEHRRRHGAEARHVYRHAFQALTGWFCPGCGTVRALHRLVAFDPAGLVAYNPLLVLALPYLLVAYLGWARRRLAQAPGPRRRLPAWAGVAVPAGVIAFWVARNLPGLEWLAPA